MHLRAPIDLGDLLISAVVAPDAIVGGRSRARDQSQASGFRPQIDPLRRRASLTWSTSF